MRIWIAGAVLAAGMAWGQAPRYVNAQVTFHKPVLDAGGKLLAWYEPGRNMGYDKVLRLGWNFIEHKVPNDTVHGTGLKIYLLNSVMDGKTLQAEYWQHNPAMVYAAFVDGLVAWYPYSGDREAIGVVREMLDYQLAHGTTPADWDWAGVPFATSCGAEKDYGHCIQNLPHEFYGGIETDKVGQLGEGYALFYELTGERKYLEAAVRCADALARHVRAGDAKHTPWAFRVDARTGQTLTWEEYGGDVASSARLFDELIGLGAGNTDGYRKARETAWKWVLEYPLRRGSGAYDLWSGFFEDVARNPENVNQFLPDMTAYYIMSRPDPAAVDEEWVSHVGHLIDWVKKRFGRGPYLGAWAIDEQGTPPDYIGCCSRAGQGSHGGRWAAINAMYAELTGDGQAREDAYRSMNYATYFTSAEGLVACCGADYGAPYWFSDGYADYLRHFNWTMAAMPETAPAEENHLLRSTTVVQEVSYGENKVAYKCFSANGTEVLRLKFRPRKVTAGGAETAERKDLNAAGYTVEAVDHGDFVVRVKREGAREAAVEGK